jgi:ribonuclease BN (tRNA processing enzyme)
MRIRPAGVCGDRFLFLIVIFCVVTAIPFSAHAQQSARVASSNGVQIVFLGTGYPAPDAARQGPSLAIVANGKAYLVDVGTGVVRQANSAFQRGVPALDPAGLDIAFLTHLHSDHTLGLPDLILTPWVLRRSKPLQLYGPTGTSAMAQHILEAYAEDIRIRITGLEGANTTGYKVTAHDVQPGNIYQDANVSVRAFLVKHGTWKEALGYRFDAGGKSIVISGDTSPADSIVDACNACDALIHEVYAGSVGLTSGGTAWMQYMKAFHTSAAELGEIATKSRAKKLILTHWILLGNAKEDDLLREIQEKYSGPIVIARDLDVIAP